MAEIICFFIWILILLLPIVIIYITRAIIKKEKKEKLVISSLVFVSIFVLVTIFYFPFQVSLQNCKQLKIKIKKDSYSFFISDQEKIKEFSRLIENQKFIRSTEKTLFGTPPVPSQQAIGMFIYGNKENNTPFHFYILCRSDFTKDSYIEKDSYCCSIQNSEDFVRNMDELVAQAIAKELDVIK